MTMIAVRRVVAQDVAQQPAQRWGGGDVEGRHRFVEEQQLRFGGQRAGDGDALGLASGELGGSSVGEVCCVDRLEPALRGGACGGSGLAFAAGGVGDVGGALMCGNSSACWDSMATPRAWAGTNTPVLVSVTTVPPSSILPWSGRSSPAIISRSVDLPTPLGPSTASTSPSSSARSNSTSALLEAGLHAHAGHTGPARRRLAEAMTITAATTMSSSDRATAASGSVSRCR